MYFKFLYILAIFVLHGIHCLALKNCHNAYGKENGYCVPFSECKHFDVVRSTDDLSEEMKDIFVNSLCDLSDKTICCIEEETKLRTTNKRPTHKTITRTTIATEVIKVKRDNGWQLLKSYQNSCGKTNYAKRSHGNEIRVGQYPWMAYLNYNHNDLEFKCGGTLITNRHVLTAANCFTANKPQNVWLGVHNISRSTEYVHEKNATFHLKTYKIAKVEVHPNYNEFTLANDIALITLDRFVTRNETRDGKFSLHIRPICLPITKRSQKYNKTVKYSVAGWGFMKNKTKSEVLMKSQIKIKDLDLCRERTQDEYNKYVINDNQICAGGDKPSENCRKYSGGPLFSYGPFIKTKRFIQHGIASYRSVFCGGRASPIIFTKVLPYLDWIAESIG